MVLKCVEADLECTTFRRNGIWIIPLVAYQRMVEDNIWDSPSYLHILCHSVP